MTDLIKRGQRNHAFFLQCPFDGVCACLLEVSVVYRYFLTVNAGKKETCTTVRFIEGVHLRWGPLTTGLTV